MDESEVRQQRMTAIHDGHIAFDLHRALSRQMAEQREKIIGKALNDYRNGKLEPVKALAYFAEMFGLDDMRSDLESTIRKGVMAKERETNGT